MVYLLVATAILFRNLRFIHSFKNDVTTVFKSSNLELSVCIPARNEEENIGKCLSSLTLRLPKHIPIWVLDDRSTDATARIVKDLSKSHPQIQLYRGKPRSEDWNGKQWACQQLLEKINTKHVLFLDADCFVGQNFYEKLYSAFIQKQSPDLLSVWPQQMVDSNTEKAVLPVLYYSLLTALPFEYVERIPRWLNDKYKKHALHFTAACGQCMLFNVQSLHECNGFECVRDEIVDDVALAKKMRAMHFRIGLAMGNGHIFCRMYTNSNKIFQGFRKNFLAGFGYNIPLFLLAGLAHFGAYLFPVFAVGNALFHQQMLWAGFWMSIILWTHLLRGLADEFGGFSSKLNLFHEWGIFWYQSLAITVVIDRLLNRSVQWKGRTINTPAKKQKTDANSSILITQAPD